MIVKRGPYPNKTGTLPEPGRLIRCEGHDWSQFFCEGEMRWISNGRTGKRAQKKLRFFRKTNDGKFESDRETWKDIETWEYVEESTQ